MRFYLTLRALGFYLIATVFFCAQALILVRLSPDIARLRAGNPWLFQGQLAGAGPIPSPSILPVPRKCAAASSGSPEGRRLGDDPYSYAATLPVSRDVCAGNTRFSDSLYAVAGTSPGPSHP